MAGGLQNSDKWFRRTDHTAHASVFKNVFGLTGFKVRIAGHNNGAHSGTGNQENHGGGVVVGHEANAIAALNAALTQPSDSTIGLRCARLPAHEAVLIFHHRLFAKLTEAYLKKLIDRKIVSIEFPQNFKRREKCGTGHVSNPSEFNALRLGRRKSWLALQRWPT